MADNVTVPGTGSVLAFDLIGGVLYQRVKIGIGADGEAADVDGGQQTMANSIPVVIASDQSPVRIEAHNLVPNGVVADQRLTVDNTLGGVQFAALDAATTHCFLTFETAPCRFTLDGSAPTNLNGHYVPANSCAVWAAAMVTAAKFIRTTASSAAVHLSQLKLGS